ncbi:MAG: nucleoside transporter, partial [Lentisphaerae bacterium]|nr:nucleoside transporter [Lentisphaerota bacterium]
VFFSALMSLFYYWRMMPWLIRGFARVFTRLMGVSGAESLCTAANIFVGIESLAAIRPYLARMTRSELCTILTGGLATVASSMLAVYVLFLKDVFPTIAGHLISASILSAPASLIMSKLIYPESGTPETLGLDIRMSKSDDAGSVDAVINGAMAGMKLVMGVVALLMAFLSLLALADMVLGGLGRWAGADLSLRRMLGWMFVPLAWCMGVPAADCRAVGGLLGLRLVATEIPAYQELAGLMASGALAGVRTPTIAAYALCGFAHVASLAIFVGGVTALVPERRADVVAVGFRSLVAATLACLMTGAVAGLFCR